NKGLQFNNTNNHKEKASRNGKNTERRILFLENSRGIDQHMGKRYRDRNRRRRDDKTRIARVIRRSQKTPGGARSLQRTGRTSNYKLEQDQRHNSTIIQIFIFKKAPDFVFDLPPLLEAT
ncbi:9070_t:CDS:1, partial [Gigaspora margarita]